MLLPAPRPRPEVHVGAAKALGHPAWRTPTPRLASSRVSPMTPCTWGVVSMPPAAGGRAAVSCGVAWQRLALFEGEQRARQRCSPWPWPRALRQHEGGAVTAPHPGEHSGPRSSGLAPRLRFPRSFLPLSRGFWTKRLVPLDGQRLSTVSFWPLSRGAPGPRRGPGTAHLAPPVPPGPCPSFPAGTTWGGRVPGPQGVSSFAHWEAQAAQVPLGGGLCPTLEQWLRSPGE